MTTVLFDMDGTLTEPRKEIQEPMITFIESLTNYSRVGIVTGSPLEYVMEQLKPALESWSGKTLGNLTFYPCNGTQAYRYNNFCTEVEQIHKVTFHDFLASAGDPSTLYMHIIMNLLNQIC